VNGIGCEYFETNFFEFIPNLKRNYEGYKQSVGLKRDLLVHFLVDLLEGRNPSGQHHFHQFHEGRMF
jgi:hypothetical protein